MLDLQDLFLLEYQSLVAHCVWTLFVRNASFSLLRLLLPGDTGCHAHCLSAVFARASRYLSPEMVECVSMTIIHSYKSYRAKFALLQNVIRCINDGSYIVLTGVDCNVQNRLEQKRPLATLSLAVPNQSERDYVCPICFEHVADQLLLPCHHRLCAECLLDWRRKSLLKKHKGTQCCFCRQTIQDIEVLSL